MKTIRTSKLRGLFWVLVLGAVILGSAFFQEHSKDARNNDHRVQINGRVGDVVVVEGFGDFQVEGIESFMQIEDLQTEGIFLQVEIAQKIRIEGDGFAYYALVSEQDKVFQELGETGFCDLSVNYILTDCRPYFELPRDSLEGLELVIRMHRGDGKFNFVEPHVRIPLDIDSKEAERLVEEAQGESLVVPEISERLQL